VKGVLMRRWSTIVISMLLTTMLAIPAGAITNGREDTNNEYPFVGLLAFYDDGGVYMHRCTGTLVSDTVVLTAAHCTDGTASAFAYFVVQVPDDFRENPTGLAGATHTSPHYNPRTISNDVGVVVLQSPAPYGGPYPSLPTVGLLSQMKADHEIQDDSFVAVGYGGVTGFPPPIIEFDLIRRIASSPYGGLTRNNLHLQQNPNVDDAGGTCFGDSGGPHFWEDTLVLVAVTSWGDAICRSNDMTQRIDLQSALDFIEGFLSG